MVKNALPAAPTNKLKTVKILKKPNQQLPAVLKKPSRYTFRNNVLCRLWWITPLSILLFTGCLDLFNPTNLFSAPSFPIMDVGVVALAVSAGFCLLIAYRKRNAIVLATYELAQIVGLPTVIEKLPVALGKVPLSRMQLGSKHIDEETKGQKNANFRQREN
jgi:hypothetical protein